MDIKVITLSCGNCGAPLEAPESARFLTCAHCKSRLEIQRTNSAIFTSVLERVNRVANDVEVLRLENEIVKLERDWEVACEPLMVKTKTGKALPPGDVTKLFCMVVCCVLAVAIILIGSYVGRGAAAYVISGVFGLGVAGCLIGNELAQAKKYTAALRRHLLRRQELVARLERAKRAPHT